MLKLILEYKIAGESGSSYKVFLVLFILGLNESYTLKSFHPVLHDLFPVLIFGQRIHCTVRIVIFSVFILLVLNIHEFVSRRISSILPVCCLMVIIPAGIFSQLVPVLTDVGKLLIAPYLGCLCIPVTKIILSPKGKSLLRLIRNLRSQMLHELLRIIIIRRLIYINSFIYLICYKEISVILIVLFFLIFFKS